MIRSLRRVPPGLAAAFVVALTAAGCAGREAAPDVSRARSDVEMLASTIGSRPIGSPADEAAREFVAGELRGEGFDVRLQAAEAVDVRDGITAPVVNVIASRGAGDDAIALTAHLDSVPDGPGASDDGLGVATCLESARVLSASPMRHALMVIVTDGEEVGLMGARAAVADAEVRRRVRVVLNFDGTGSAGSPVLFEAGPGWGAPLTAWARGATAPFGGSFGVEIYRRLPNDTDFSQFKTIGASGLNFAPVIDSYAYHTDRDTAARLEPSTIAREIANTVSTVRVLDGMDLRSSGAPPTFFDLAGRRGVVYGRAMTIAVAILACLGGTIAWLLLVRQTLKARKITGLVAGWIWAIVSTLAAFAGMVAVAWILRRVRGQVTPWYASPQWFFAAMAAAGVLALWCCARIAAPFATRVRASASAMIWCSTLPVWIGLTAFLQIEAPGASYLTAIPLLGAGVLFGVLRHRLWIRIVSAVVFAVVAALWIRNILTLLFFLVPLLGWLPIVTPVWLYPAVIALGGLMLWPPFVAATAGATRSRAVLIVTGAVPLLGLIACGAVAWRTPAYTADRPARRTVHYVQDHTRGEAWWEVAGPEPSPGIDRQALPEARWQRESGAPSAAARADGFRLPFPFRAVTSPLLATPPADVTATWSAVAGEGRLDVTISPHQLLAARLMLPASLKPSSSSVAGVVSGTQWTATFVAVPSTGLTVHLTFGSTATSPEDRLLVALIATGVPGGATPRALPAWLPTATDTWQARTTVIVKPEGLQMPQ